jgi:GT2 family glycosyltransferase
MDYTLSEDASVWTIVVTHNSESVIFACLTSLECATRSTRIVVVDNGSTDSTVGLVRRDFPNVLVHSGANIGFAGGCNIGVLLAGDDADAFLFLNPDASVSPTCLERLLNALENDEGFAVVSPKILHSESGLIEYAGALLDFENLNFGVVTSEVGGEVTSTTFETGRPAGAAMLVRKSSLDVVGPMDASYFLYWEECEWATRVHRHGLKVGYVSDAIALHSLSHSTGGEGSKVFEYYYTRNLLRLVAEAGHVSKLGSLRRLSPTLIRRLRGMADPQKLPTLARRLRGIANPQSLRFLVTAACFESLGVLDFLLGKHGHRARLPSLRVQSTNLE